MHNVHLKADFTPVAMFMLMFMFMLMSMLMISFRVMMSMAVFILLTRFPDFKRVRLPTSSCSTHIEQIK